MEMRKRAMSWESSHLRGEAKAAREDATLKANAASDAVAHAIAAKQQADKMGAEEQADETEDALIAASTAKLKTEQSNTADFNAAQKETVADDAEEHLVAFMSDMSDKMASAATSARTRADMLHREAAAAVATFYNQRSEAESLLLV